MSVIQATLALYRDAGRDTLKALPRSAIPFAWLVLAGPALGLFIRAVASSGQGSGFIVGFFEIFMVATYLGLLRISALQSRTASFADLQENLGWRYWDVMGVGFALTIPRFILALAYPVAVLPYTWIVSLLLNPTLEALTSERSDTLGTFGRALEFMKLNWPEWLAVHLLFGAVWLGLTSAPDLIGATEVVATFGPLMKFVYASVGLLLLPVSLLLGAKALLLAAFAHSVMLFRVALYKRLARSSRRSRAWQARMG